MLTLAIKSEGHSFHPPRATRRLAVALGLAALVLAACSSGAATLRPTATALRTASPAPSPTPDVASLFVARLKSMSAGSMTLTGDLEIGKVAATIAGRYDFNGPNDYGTTTITTGKVTQTTEDTTWAGKAYERTIGGAWFEKPPTSGGGGISKVLTSGAGITDMGLATKDGLQLHRLVPTGVALDPEDIGMDGTGTVAIEFMAKDDGTPVSMTLTLDLQQTTAQGLVPVSGTMEFTFAPAVSPNISAPDPVFATAVSTKGFSFGYPEGWDARSDKICEGYDGPNLEWLGACTHAKGRETLTSRTSYVVYELKTKMKATIASNVAGSLGGEPARIITYKYVAPGTGIPLFGIYVIAYHGSTGIDFTWESPAGSEAADTQTFNYAIASFKFAS